MSDHQRELKACAILILFVSFSTGEFISNIKDIIDTNTKQYKIVNSSNGLIRGQLKSTQFNNKPYYAFQGIPYAKPPIKELRFKAPEPIISWAPKIIDAFEYSNACMQPPLPILIYGMSENCLFLNIFVPENSTKIPVMFHIHGGAFVEGSGDDFLFGPDFIVEHNVILVTLNYRLGIFGFLSLNTSEISGNMGLKDQQLALKWIHENIDHFGGDSNRITVSGHSAGAISANLQALNDKSTGYFHKLITMSGVAIANIAFKVNHPFDQLFTLAKLQSSEQTFSMSDCNDLIEFLASTTAESLVNLTTSIGWAATIEDSAAVRPFLTETPLQKYKSFKCNNITSLHGFNNAESLFFMTNEQSRPEFIDNFLENFNKTFGSTFLFNVDPKSIDNVAMSALLDDLQTFYFENAIDHNAKMAKYIELMSDILLTHFIQQVIDIHAMHSCNNSYAYEFSVDSALNFGKIEKQIKFPGAGHVDDQYYIFWSRLFADKYRNLVMTKDINEHSRISLRIIKVFTTFITDFVKFGERQLYKDEGQPNIFNPSHKNQPNFFKITNNGLSLSSGGVINKKKLTFLNDLYERARRLIQQTDRKQCA